MPRHEGIRDERYKLIYFYEFNQWEFYDLKNDPYELNNLINDQQSKAEIMRMKKRLKILKVQYNKKN